MAALEPDETVGILLSASLSDDRFASRGRCGRAGLPTRYLTHSDCWVPRLLDKNCMVDPRESARCEHPGLETSVTSLFQSSRHHCGVRRPWPRTARATRPQQFQIFRE